MAQVHFFNAGQVDPVARPVIRDYCQVKNTWTDDWQHVPYLRPLVARDVAGPGIASARMEWQVGEILQADDTIFRNYDLQDLRDKFVRLVVADELGDRPVWTGVIAEESFMMDGSVSIPVGVQPYGAWGLEHLLDRIIIDKALIRNASGAVKTLEYTPIFNFPGLVAGVFRGNRSRTRIEDGPFVFETIFDVGSTQPVWTNKDIIENLLDLAFRKTGITFALSGLELDADLAIPNPLDEIKLNWNFQGMSIWGALSMLIPRERGFVYVVRTDGEGIVNVHVDTILDKALTIQGVTIPANSSQGFLNLGSDVTLDQVMLVRESNVRYDRIAVAGEFMMSMFTASDRSQPGGILQRRGWSTADETEYKVSLADSDASKNDTYRLSDRFDNVFQRFIVRDDWDWMTEDAGGISEPVAPKLDENGKLIDPLVSQVVFNDKRIIEHWIPVYEDGSIYDGFESPRPPLVVVKHKFAFNTLTGFFQIDKIGMMDSSAAAAGCHVIPLERGMGIRLEPEINHALGLNHFDASVDKSNITEVVDYRDIHFTMFVQTHQRLRVEADVRKNDSVQDARTKYISVPGAEFWYVAPQTVVGLNKDPEPVRVFFNGGNSGTIRDDSPRLRSILALAVAWYGQERVSINLAIRHQITSQLPVGSLVVDVTAADRREPVGTVVTSKVYKFQPDKVTEYETAFLDLDLVGAAPTQTQTSVISTAGNDAFINKETRNAD